MFNWFKKKNSKSPKREETAVAVSEEVNKIVEEQGGTPEITKDLVRKILHPIKDPDLHVSIVDLGLIKDVHIDGAKVKVEMVLTSPGCPHGPLLLTMAQRMLEMEEYLEDPEVELVIGEYLSLEDLSDEQRLNLGLDF